VLRRVHQEDMCQALGVPIPSKYEHEPDGPSLRRIAALLRRIAADPAADLDRLAQMTVFTVAVGNADLHGRNVSLLHGDEGPTLAPLYDVVATVMYGTVSHELGMYAGDARDVAAVSSEDLHAEMRAWGLPSRRAEAVTEQTLDRLSAAIDETTVAVPAAERVADVVRARIERLQQGLTAGTGADDSWALPDV
jgi:serine/threonine-protein kinase HipA